MGNNDTIEEIDTFGHEETVVTEETVTEEEPNEKNNFRVSIFVKFSQMICDRNFIFS